MMPPMVIGPGPWRGRARVEELGDDVLGPGRGRPGGGGEGEAVGEDGDGDALDVLGQHVVAAVEHGERAGEEQRGSAIRAATRRPRARGASRVAAARSTQ